MNDNKAADNQPVGVIENGIALLHLLHISDSTLPVGSYAHSAGLETYVQLGVVKDAATANTFVVQMLEQNLQYTDAALLSLAYQSIAADDFNRLLVLDNLCSAVKLPKEMRLASYKLGLRLMKIFQPLCDNEWCNKYVHAIKTGKAAGHYSIAFALCAYALNITKRHALSSFYYNAAAGFVSNSVKLVPLGQQQGQEILFSLHGLINDLVTKSIEPDETLIGICCTGFDIKCMQHERLYSRLYMS